MTKKALLWIIIAVGFLTYLSSLFNSFVWDDEQFIQKNVFIREWQYLPQIFTTNTIAGSGQQSNYYRPLTTLSFAVDYHLWGLQPFGFHLTNLIFHTGAAVFLFLFLDELLKRRRTSFWISLVFLTHPLQTEAVTYANSRGDSHYAFWLFLSLYLFLHVLHHKTINLPIYRGKRLSLNSGWLFLLTFLFYLFSLLSKEIALSATALYGMILLFIAPKSKVGWGVLVGLGGLAVIYLLLRLTVLNFGNTLNFYQADTEYTRSLVIRLLTFCKVFWTYLSLIFLPFSLHMERDTELVRSFSSGWVLGFLGLLGSLGGLGWFEYLKRKTYFILFGMGWFFVMIAPVSGIVPINGILYEHWLYTPLIGIVITIVGLGAFLPVKRISSQIFIWGLGSLVVVYICLTWYQNYLWADPVRFYEYTLQYANSPRLHNNLAMSYADVGKFDKAIPEYQKAIGLADVYPQTHHNLANSYGSVGKYDLAEQEYLTALNMDPNFFFSYPQLVNLYLKTKQPAKALPLLEKLDQQNPNNLQVILTYGKVLKELGKAELAQQKFNQALQLSNYNPEVKAYINQ